jgi:hypothetical protein
MQSMHLWYTIQESFLSCFDPTRHHCGKPVDISRYAVQTGKQGGNVTKRKYGSKHFSEAGKKGMAKRWGKKPAEDYGDRG